MLTNCSISSSDMSSSSSSRGHSSHLSYWFDEDECVPLSPCLGDPPQVQVKLPSLVWMKMSHPGICASGLSHLDWSIPNWFSARAWQAEPTHSQQPSWNHLKVSCSETLLQLSSDLPVGTGAHGGAGGLALVPAHALAHVGHGAVDGDQPLLLCHHRHGRRARRVHDQTRCSCARWLVGWGVDVNGEGHYWPPCLCIALSSQRLGGFRSFLFEKKRADFLKPGRG